MSQFNVYDIFGYLLPGTAVAGVFLFVVGPFVDLTGMSSLGGGVAMLLGCYLVGHVLRSTIGQAVKPIQPSPELLSPGSPIFSALQKESIIRALNSS